MALAPRFHVSERLFLRPNSVFLLQRPQEVDRNGLNSGRGEKEVAESTKAESSEKDPIASEDSWQARKTFRIGIKENYHQV